MKGVKGEKSKAKVTVSVFGWMSFALTVLAIIAIFFSLFGSSNNGKEIFGFKMLVVQSDSMSRSADGQEEIFFNSGDVIFVKQVEDVYSLKEGDVIAFVSTNKDSFGKTITHKIKEVKYASSGKLIGYVTYGVRTGEIDQTLVHPEHVLGVYSGKIPLVGHMIAFLKTPQGYVTTIGVPSILLIIYFSVKIGGFINQRECNKKFEELENKIKELQKENK